jgi:hypothetical protein
MQSPHTCFPIWQCQQCGVTERRTGNHFLRRYCSRTCKGIAQKGAANPAYKHGRRIDSVAGLRRRKPNQPMTAPKMRAIAEWAAARQAIGTAVELAKRLEIPLYAVYRYAPLIRVAP